MKSADNATGNPSDSGIRRALSKFGLSGNTDGRRSGPADMDAEQARLKSHATLRQEGLELWPLPGLAPMTRVRTSFGDVHAIALRKGDEVLTRGGEYRPILWLNRISLEEHILNLKPDSNPIVIGADALGKNAPGREIMVSPRQIICADENTGLGSSREAAMLVSRPGIRRLRETGLSYTMFHIGVSAEIYCEGLYLKFPLEA